MIETVIELGLIIALICYLIQWRSLEKRFVKICKALLDQNNTLSEECEALKSILRRYDVAWDKARNETEGGHKCQGEEKTAWTNSMQK